MVSIPFAYQYYHRDSALQPSSQCQNLYLEHDVSGNTQNPDGAMLIQRPGLTRFQQLPDLIRGFFYSENAADNRIYAVSGNQLMAIDGVTADIVGTVQNDGLSVAFAPTFDKMAVVSGGNLYTYFQDDQTTGTYGQLAMPDDRQVVDITDLNNYIIIACPDGRFYWLLPGTNAVGALDFLTAESSTDGLVAVKRIGDEVYFFGASTVEVWTATGDLDIPFTRSNGRNLNIGCLYRDTVHLLDNTLFWLGSTGYVYRASDVPIRISDPSIEERIAGRTGAVSALVMPVEGHNFYVLKIPGQGSFAYDVATKKWFQFSSMNHDTWRPGFAQTINSTILCADDSSGLVWTVDASKNTDDGDPIVRIATGTIPLPMKPAKNSNFIMNVGSSAACNWRLRWQDAQDSDWTDYQTLPARSGNDRISIYRLNQARGQYRTFELSVLDDVRVRFGDAFANDAWQ